MDPQVLIFNTMSWNLQINQEIHVAAHGYVKGSNPQFAYVLQTNPWVSTWIWVWNTLETGCKWAGNRLEASLWGSLPLPQTTIIRFDHFSIADLINSIRTQIKYDALENPGESKYV